MPSTMRARVVARFLAAFGSATRSYSSGVGARTRRNRSFRHDASGLHPNARRVRLAHVYLGRPEHRAPLDLHPVRAALQLALERRCSGGAAVDSDPCSDGRALDDERADAGMLDEVDAQLTGGAAKEIDAL